MTPARVVLCPVDFSQGSRGALGIGAAIAAQLGARLVVLTVSDPLLAEVAEFQVGAETLTANTLQELDWFVRSAFDRLPHRPPDPVLLTAVGKPAAEILRVATEQRCDLIVMSSHGLTGIRKLFFGATTERVLRETTIPVLVSHASDDGVSELARIRGTARPVLVPVDLSAPGAGQVQMGARIAEALNVPVLLAYVIEPLRFPVPTPMSVANLDAERRLKAESALAELAGTVPQSIRTERLIAYGDPAEEVAKVARDRHASLIVMGLHASTLIGPRMGSVTYRVLCLAPTIVLALPPAVPQRA